MPRFEDQSTSIYYLFKSKSDFHKSPEPLVVTSQISTTTQTEMESQVVKRIKFNTLLIVGIVLILCSVTTIIVTQVISYFIFYPDRYEAIDLLGIAIWGPVLFMLVCGAFFLSDILKVKKFTPMVILTTFIMSAVISFGTAGLAIYCTVQSGSDDSARKILGGIMAFACICVGISSTFLAAYTCRANFNQRTDIVPPTLHYIAKPETTDQL